MIRLGFVILSHRCPQQTRRMIDRLVTMFDGPPIACHHDFGQSPLDVRGLPATFRLVQPHLKTGWGQFVLVEAAMAALRLLYQTDSPPDWFVLLSSADYPIQPAERILEDLQATSADALIRHQLIDRHAQRKTWQQTCLRRYHRRAWRLGQPPRNFEANFRLPWWLSGPLLPFSRKFKCYAGGFWFTANARCAEYLLAGGPQQRRLARHYVTVPIPDESFFQCLLCNAPQFRIVNDNYRFIDWSKGGRNPKTLTCDDLPELLASPAHFARKFDIQHDADVLDRLDQVISCNGFESGCRDVA